MIKIRIDRNVKVNICVNGFGVYFYSKSGGIGKTRLFCIVDSCVDLGYKCFTSTFLHGKRSVNGNLRNSKILIYDRVDLYRKQELTDAIKEMEEFGKNSVVLVDSKNDISRFFNCKSNLYVSTCKLICSKDKIEVKPNDIFRG